MKHLALFAFLQTVACTNLCSSGDAMEHKRQLMRLNDGRSTVRIVAIHELAEGADRETLTAIARSAKDAPEDVRCEIAAALAKSKEPEAIDLIGALLRDPADSVRAAAVRALSGKSGERAAAYIVSAYESGGVLTRVAISEGSPEVFRRAVASEAGNWRRAVEERRKDGHAQIRASALADLGRDSTEPIVAELTARLVDPDPTIEAAAAAGLLNAQAVDQRPALISALRSSPPLVVGAAAKALHGLGAETAVDALTDALTKADGEVASEILDALEDVTLTTGARATLCKIAEAGSDVVIAQRAALLAGKEGCTMPPGVPDAALDAGTRLLVLLALEHKDADAVSRARKLLSDPQAGVATAAAAYLGRFGEKPDGEKLIELARSQLGRIVDARSAKADAEREKKAVAQPQPGPMTVPQFLQNQLTKDGTNAPKKKPNKLQQLLEARKAVDHPTPVEDRPGAIELVQVAALSGASLGADCDEMARELFADSDPTLRLVAADLANAEGDAGEELRAKIRDDADSDLRLHLALLEYAAKRAGALDRLTALVPKLDAPSRARIAADLAPDATELKPLMLQFLAENDVASPVAANALAAIAGDDIDKALIQSMNAPVPVGRYAALTALADRHGPSIDAAIASAAVHPSPDMREAAMQALVKRRACNVAERLAPLAADYSGPVRAAVANLRGVCSKGK